MYAASLNDTMRAHHFILFDFLYSSVGYLIRGRTHAVVFLSPLTEEKKKEKKMDNKESLLHTIILKTT